MPILKSLKGFKLRLIIGLSFTAVLTLIFGIYVFLHIRQLDALLKTVPLTQDEIILLQKGIREFSPAIVLFSLLIAVFIISLLLYLTVTLTSSLRVILNGITKISEGDLSFRIPLSREDEFGEVVKLLNNAIAKIEQKVFERTQQVNTAINQLTSQNRLLAAIRSLDEAALSTIEVDPLAQVLVDVASKELHSPLCGISIVEEEFNHVRRVALSGYNPQMIQTTFTLVPIPYHKQTISLERTDNLIVKAILEKRLIVTSKISDLQRGIFTEDISNRLQKYLEDNMDYKQIFLYPLVTKNKALGLIYFAMSKTSDQVTKTEYSIMESFTKEVTTVMENALLYKTLRTDKTLISAERNKLAVTISAITDAVIAVSLDRKIIIFNSSAEKLTGYSLEEVLGKPIDSVIKIFDKTLELLPSNYCPIRTDGNEGVIFRKRALRLMGKKEAYVNLVAGQIAEGLENNLGCILTMHDVTEEQELEKMKLDFVSMAAHELRTPLTAIKGYLYLYLKDYRESLDKNQSAILQRINISAQRLTGLIENLLNISRIEKGNVTLNLAPVDWVNSVNTAVEEVSEEAKEKGIELTVQLPSYILPKVYVDPLRINEVLSNLLSNALNFTPREGKVKVLVERKGGEIITHIEDTGKGIPEEALPHLFTKFFKISGFLQSGSKGTGLGLYIAKSIVEMHHGRIWAESKLGQGSIFSFTLSVYTGETQPLLGGSLFHEQH